LSAAVSNSRLCISFVPATAPVAPIAAPPRRAATPSRSPPRSRCPAGSTSFRRTPVYDIIPYDLRFFPVARPHDPAEPWLDRDRAMIESPAASGVQPPRTPGWRPRDAPSQL
jgi:hypothetical protein